MNNPKLPSLPFAICSWKDAWIDGTEAVALNDVHLNHKASMHHTAGWVLFNNDEGLSIANEYCSEDETYRGRTYIPAGMILKLEIYSLTKPRKARVGKAKADPETLTKSDP